MRHGRNNEDTIMRKTLSIMKARSAVILRNGAMLKVLRTSNSLGNRGLRGRIAGGR